MVQHSMDNISHVVQLARLIYPIQRLDRIHVNQYQVPLCYHPLSFDLCVLNQSEIV